MYTHKGKKLQCKHGILIALRLPLKMSDSSNKHVFDIVNF